MAKISKSQVLNGLTLAAGVAATVQAYATTQHWPLPAWATAGLLFVAGLSRSIIPALSGVPGQQTNPPAGSGTS